jgi:hypothetical protein
MLYRDIPIENVSIAGHDLAARTITVRLCTWDDPRDVVDLDGTAYREQYAPGSIELGDPVHVVDRHLGTLIGRAEPDTLVDDGQGPTVDLVVARSTAGNDLLANVDAGVIRNVSIEIEPVDAVDRDGVLTRTRSIVHGVAFAFRPQLAAPILAVRGDNPNGDPMHVDTIRDTPTPPPDAIDVVDLATLNRALDDVRRELVVRPELAAPGHPAAQFRSLEEWALTALDDRDVAGVVARALADQITPNNPGVIPPAWVSTVYGIVDAGRPSVAAFGTRPLPASGMEVDWPYFDGDLSALVGEQVAEKTAITSVRVDLKRGSVPLRTWAGGSDLSYQLIRRSSPSYREGYMRIMFAAYAAETGAAATLAATTAATGSVDYTPTGDTDGRGLATALFEASVQVQAATGSPASFALLATDLFIAAGGMLIPAPYGTSNQPGTATASTLAVNVNGIACVHDPYLAAGTGLVSNGQAGGWFEDGPFTVTAEDVEKLGQNVAVWGMGNFGAFAPAGIVKLAAAGLPLAAKSK